MIAVADLAPCGELRSRALPAPLLWMTAERGCRRCGKEWVEVFAFKSVRKAALYLHGRSCPWCDFDPWRRVREEA